MTGRGLEHNSESQRENEANEGVFSKFHSSNESSFEIPRVTKVKANISSMESDFQEILHDIDSNISKFDSPIVGLSKSGPIIAVDQAECPKYHSCTSEDGLSLKTDKDMGISFSPRGVELKSRGWKRLVQEQCPSEA